MLASIINPSNFPVQPHARDYHYHPQQGNDHSFCGPREDFFRRPEGSHSCTYAQGPWLPEVLGYVGKSMLKLRPSDKPEVSTPRSEFTGTETTHSTGRDVQPRSTAQYGPSLPALASLASLTSASTMQPSSEMSSPTGGRGFGMHDILNPPSSSGSTVFQDLRQSPHRSASGTFATHSMRSPRGRKRGERGESTSPGPSLQMPSETRHARRMLTPKSPAMRALSTGSRLSPASTGISTIPSGLSESRLYTADPADYRGQVPPVPAMPPVSTGSMPMTGPMKHGAATSRTSMDSSRASYFTGPQIGSDSPRITGERGGPSPPISGACDSGACAESQMAGQGHDVSSRAHQRVVTTGPTAYQIELDTEAGPITVDVNIDTQQASKLADEKRRRNAGASARFRQRRKEKEAAASQAIADLQRQMRSIEEERDFYKHERNLLRDTCTRTPGAQNQPRAPSPGDRRVQEPKPALIPDVSPHHDHAKSEVSESGPSQRQELGPYPQSISSPSAGAPSTCPRYALPLHHHHPIGAVSSPGPMIDSRSCGPHAPQVARTPQQFDPFRP